MPKVKTRSAAKKRFAKVGGRKGVKIKRSMAFKRHLLTKKSAKTKRNLRKIGYVSAVDEKRILALIPY